jgi:hypothetical protein
MDKRPDPSGSLIAGIRMVGRTAAGITMVLVGIAVVMAGFVLYAGNKSGRFPTFPFAGGLTMVLGAALMAGGVTLAGRRATIVFGISMLLAGAGLYVLGSLRDDPLFSVLFRLVGVVVGFLGSALAFFRAFESGVGPNRLGK